MTILTTESVSTTLGTAMTSSRKRLTPDQRRIQLLDIGSRLFAERPYDDVWIEEVAELAGVSKGLMYHYFPSKRDFFVAVVRRESDQMVQTTAPDVSLPLDQQVSAGLTAYISYSTEHGHGLRAVNRGAISGDAEIQSIIDAEFEIQQARILAALDPESAADAVTRLALKGWIAFVNEVCVEWLEHPAISQTDVHDLCMRALAGVLAH